MSRLRLINCLLLNWLKLLVCLLLSCTLASAAYAQSSHKNIIKAIPIYQNQQVGDYVQSVLDKIIKASAKPKKQYPVYVLDNPGINAFVTQSNKMYIYRGLLTYVTSEAELAAILAHELGHIRDRHALRLKSSKLAQGVVSVAAAITARSNEVGNVVNIFSQAQNSGYGRNLELRADELAAQYLYDAGYSPSALQSVLILLKQHQRFSQYQAKQKGRALQTYHGVFATHPRNDKRLIEVIEQAGELPPNEDFVGRKALRQAIDGIIFGANVQLSKTDSFVYIHRQHGIAITLSNHWQIKKETAHSLTFSSDTDKLTLDLQVFRQPSQQCQNTQTEPPQPPLPEHEDSHQSVQSNLYHACIQIGTRSFHFQGSSAKSKLSSAAIEAFQDLLSQFRRITQNDYRIANSRHIVYRQARPGDTFSKLASNKIIGEDTENYLRLINGFYPSGEPEPGYWLKLIH